MVQLPRQAPQGLQGTHEADQASRSERLVMGEVPLLTGAQAKAPVASHQAVEGAAGHAGRRCRR